MKKLLKKTLKLILPIVLGGFILFWVYRDFDFAEAGDVLKHGGGCFSRCCSEYLRKCFVAGGGGRRWSLWMRFLKEEIV